VSDITAAASVLLARGPLSSEAFVVRRAETLRAFGGFHAFPGGKVSCADADLAARLGDASPYAAQRVAAVRELFEETGVLVACRADGSFPASDIDFTHFRTELLADRLTLGDVLSRRQLAIRLDDIPYAGTLVTPAFAPLRFDTAFFVTALPPGQRPEIWPGELTSGDWYSAGELLRRWARAEMIVSPPTISLMQLLFGRPISELPERFQPLIDAHAAGRVPPIWFAPDVRMLPLFSHGLPPSTHTNAYLVGSQRVHLLDPGPTDEGEQQLLFDVLDALPAEGRRLHAVVLTHQHPDHIGAVNACARRYGVPVQAHPLTAEALRGKVEVTRHIQDGERLDLGGGHLEAIFTPGHARGHLAFYETDQRLLFVGDMVSTLSSVVIAPPEGNLAQYLASLERLRKYPARLLLPAHGPPSARPDHTLAEALEHRRLREEQLLSLLGEQPRSVAELALEMYRGLPAKMMRFAEMQVLAGLLKLQDEGRMSPAADGRYSAMSGRPNNFK
jgi:glyoxylase-like metal-dependent hydrolase (beta-lactamase superfamily II)/8-oxo-dGTP pyrophosphatase MutT (NUDIX family)